MAAIAEVTCDEEKDCIKRLASRLGIDADWLQSLIVDYSSSSGMSCEETVRLLEHVAPAVDDRVPFDLESLRKAVNELETQIAKHGCVDTKPEKRFQIINASGRPRRKDTRAR